MGTFDAIVVGGGPAGSTTARELAAAGARVLVVDRAEWPRYKACGGGVPLRAERMLPFPIDSVVEDSVSRIEMSARGKMAFTKRSNGPFARMVMRDRFDMLLLEQAQRAGAELRTGTGVRELDLNGRARIRADGFEAEADVLICADGAHSPVGRMAGLGGDLAECAAWEVEVRGRPRDASVGEAMTLIDLGYDPWGYAWLFPKAELLSIGIVLPRELAGQMKALTDRYLARLGLEGAEVEIARGHKIRFRRGGEAIASERVALAGDAAGLADEFTAEGISYAIHSGQAGRARHPPRARRRWRPAGATSRMWRRRSSPSWTAARAIAYMFYGMLKRAQPSLDAGEQAHTVPVGFPVRGAARGVQLRARSKAGRSIDGGRHSDAAASGHTAPTLIAT